MKSRIIDNLRNNMVIFSFSIIFILFSFFIPRFYTIENLAAIGRQVSINGMIAAAMTLVIITAGIDLSVGSMLAFAGVAVALLIKTSLNPFFSIVITLLLGGLVGLFNGFMITKGHIPPFITTLATLSILRAAALALSGGTSVSNLGNVFVFIGRGTIFGLPFPLFLMILVFIICYYLLSQTRFGTHLYAIGGNEGISKTLGLQVNRIKVYVYVLSGIFASLAAIVLAGRLNSGQPLTGQGAELDAIAAVVVGGTNLFGGKGTIIGTAFGVAIIGMLTNGLILLNLSFYWQLAVKGFVILAAVWLAKERNE